MAITPASSKQGPSDPSLSYDGRIGQLKEQIELLKSKIGKIGKGSGDSQTKQRQIGLIELQIQQLLTQIHRMQARQEQIKKTGAATQTATQEASDAASGGGESQLYILV
jgi:predicted RNase H-like nuclease (RuvC/YqgF family)